jgi:hypothetical protein
VSNPIDGLARVPEHMRHAMEVWMTHGEPHPKILGKFMRALLTNDLVSAFAAADEENAASMRAWAMYLYHDAPLGSWGSHDALEKWHRLHHPKPSERKEAP